MPFETIVCVHVSLIERVGVIQYVFTGRNIAWRDIHPILVSVIRLDDRHTYLRML